MSFYCCPSCQQVIRQTTRTVSLQRHSLSLCRTILPERRSRIYRKHSQNARLTTKTYRHDELVSIRMGENGRLDRSTLPRASTDIRFIEQLKGKNFDTVSRDISKNRVLDLNSFDAIAMYSRRHYRPATSSTSGLELPLPSASFPRNTKERRKETRRPQSSSSAQVKLRSRNETHAELFHSIDIGLRAESRGWPKLFYNKLKDPNRYNSRIRSAALSYLVRAFVMQGKIIPILELYQDITSSKLPFELQERDAVSYSKALLRSLSVSSPLTEDIRVCVLKMHQSMSIVFSTNTSFRRTYSYEEAVLPSLLCFLSATSSFETAFSAITKQLSKVYIDSTSALIPRLYTNLSLLSRHDLSVKEDRQVTYDMQKKLLERDQYVLKLLAQIPRYHDDAIGLAKGILKFAVSVEQIILVKHALFSSSHSIMLSLQSDFLKAMLRLSKTSTMKHSEMQRTKLASFLTEYLTFCVGLGGPKIRDTLLVLSAAVYAQLGAIGAIERLLKSHLPVFPADSSTKLVHGIHDLIRGLAKLANAQSNNNKAWSIRLSSIIHDITQRYLQQCVISGFEPYQPLLRDMIEALGARGNAVAILEIWHHVFRHMNPQNLKRSTVESVVTGLRNSGDMSSAVKVVEQLCNLAPNGLHPTCTRLSRDKKVSESTVQSLIPSPALWRRLCTNITSLDHVFAWGVNNGISWNSVAYLRILRNKENVSREKEDHSDTAQWMQNLQSWAMAVQDCAEEILEERQASIRDTTVRHVEKALS